MTRESCCVNEKMGNGKILVIWNKRGVTSKLLLEIGGLIFAVILFWVFLSFGQQIFSLFAKDPTTELAKANFNALASHIEEVAASEKDFDAIFGRSITIPEDFHILGFDAGLAGTECPIWAAVGTCVKKLKPTLCGIESCLVIVNKYFSTYNDYYQLESDDPQETLEKQKNLDDNVIAFRTFPDIDQLSGPYKDDKIKTIVFTHGTINQFDYGNEGDPKKIENQFLRGIIESQGFDNNLGQDPVSKGQQLYVSEDLIQTGYEFGVRPLYIEKLKLAGASGSKTQIYLGKQTDITTERYSTIQAQFTITSLKGALDYCQNTRGHQLFSTYRQYQLEKPCLCGEVKASLAGTDKIVIDSSTLKLIRTSETGTTEELATFDFTPKPWFARHASNIPAFMSLPGNIEITSGQTAYLYSVNDEIAVSREKIPAESCLSLADNDASKEAVAVSIGRDFSTFYEFYKAEDFESQPCVMTRYNFEQQITDYRLPANYKLFINKDIENVPPAKISIINADGEPIFESSQMQNDVCYIDQSSSPQYPNALKLPWEDYGTALSDYTAFIYAEDSGQKRICFENEYYPPASSVTNCEWKANTPSEVKSNNAVTSFIDCLQGSGQECIMKATEFTSDYALMLRKDSSSLILGIQKKGFLVKEVSLPSTLLCLVTGDGQGNKIVYYDNSGGISIHPDSEQVFAEIQSINLPYSKDYKFEKFGASICLDLSS